MRVPAAFGSACEHRRLEAVKTGRACPAATDVFVKRLLLIRLSDASDRPPFQEVRRMFESGRRVVFVVGVLESELFQQAPGPTCSPFDSRKIGQYWILCSRWKAMCLCSSRFTCSSETVPRTSMNFVTSGSPNSAIANGRSRSRHTAKPSRSRWRKYERWSSNLPAVTFAAARASRQGRSWNRRGRAGLGTPWRGLPFRRLPSCGGLFATQRRSS